MAVISITPAGATAGSACTTLTPAGSLAKGQLGKPVQFSYEAQVVGRIGPGLDVRGDNGYFVAAPERHPATKARYELLGALTDLPPWPRGPAAEPVVRATATRLVGTSRQARRRSATGAAR